MAIEYADDVILALPEWAKAIWTGLKWRVRRAAFMGHINEIDVPPALQRHCDTLVVCIVQTFRNPL